MVLFLAVLTALVNAIASIAQRLGVEAEAPTKATGPAALLLGVLRRPIWLLGTLAMLGGFVLQALALHAGSLTVVQPVLTTELLFIVVVMRVWFAVSVRSIDWIAAGTSVVGLAIFLIAARPIDGAPTTSLSTWLTAIGMVGGVMVGGVFLGRVGPPWARAVSLGTAAAVGFALVAALTKQFTDALAQGITTALTAPATYGVIVVGLISFALMQQAFGAGPFTASQSALILINPLASIVLGAMLFGEVIHHSPAAIAGEAIGIVALIAGSIALCKSPLVAGVHNETSSHLLAGRGWLARRRARRDAGEHQTR